MFWFPFWGKGSTQFFLQVSLLNQDINILSMLTSDGVSAWLKYCSTYFGSRMLVTQAMQAKGHCNHSANQMDLTYLFSNYSTFWRTLFRTNVSKMPSSCRLWILHKTVKNLSTEVKYCLPVIWCRLHNQKTQKKMY